MILQNKSAYSESVTSFSFKIRTVFKYSLEVEHGCVEVGKVRSSANASWDKAHQDSILPLWPLHRHRHFKVKFIIFNHLGFWHNPWYVWELLLYLVPSTFVTFKKIASSHPYSANLLGFVSDGFWMSCTRKRSKRLILPVK